MGWLSDEDREYWAELADALLDARKRKEEADCDWADAEAKLIEAMCGAEVDSLYRKDYLIELCAPDEGDVFLSVVMRPTIDLEV